MSNAIFRPVPPEPVHLALKRRDDLLKLYTHIRENYQVRIDRVFDRVAQQIGFVVATALSFTFEIADERVMGVVVTSGKQLQGTIFEREFGRLLDALKDERSRHWAARSLWFIDSDAAKQAGVTLEELGWQ